MYYVIVEPTPSQTGNCSITSRDRVITVMCPYSSFQVIAQSDDVDRVNVLHVTTSMDAQTPATVQVPVNGQYLVTVLPIQDGRGILSGMALSRTHMVTDASTMATHGIAIAIVCYFVLW